MVVNMRTAWTDEENKILQAMWKSEKVYKMSQITNVLKNRSKEAIFKRAERLYLPRWSERFKPEIDYEYLRSLGVVVEG